jgi:hypothetical protein
VKLPTLTLAALGVCLALLGCKKNIQNQEAIRQGVMNYLSKRSDLLAMDASVGSVEFRGPDEATATVHFQAKGNSSPGAGMNMQYVMERKGNDWVVKGKAGESAAHGANGMPQPAPGAAGGGSLSGMPNTPLPGGTAPGSLPPGHPTVGGSGQALPPGHPAVPTGKDQK